MKQRTALLAAAAAALLPGLAPASVALADAADRRNHFEPPLTPLTMSRTVIRELSDGKQIRVTRRYTVRFEAEDGGYRLNGKLIDVTVDVPEILRNLTQIERGRDDSGMFPIHVDPDGAIRAGEGSGAIDQNAHDQMRLQAGSVLGKSGIPSDSAQRGAMLVAQTLQARPGSPWPVDLFRIEPGEHHVSRTVALPGGGEGRIEVVTEVDALLANGLPHTIKRKIIILLAGSRRVSHEIWSFQPDAG